MIRWHNIHQFYPNWSKLSEGYKQSIFDERGKLDIKGGGNHKPLNKKNISGLHPSSPKKKAAQKIHREISSLKAKCKELEEKISASEKIYEHQDNAGNQFSGRKGKNKQKRSD